MRRAHHLVPALLLTACTASVRPQSIHPELAALGNGARRTAFELQDTSALPELPADPYARKRERSRSKPTFWALIGIGIVTGVAAAAAGGAAAYTQHQMSEGIENGITHDRFDQLEQRGETLDKVVIGTSVVAAVALGAAVILYGWDYSRCGPLAPARRRCPQR